MRHSCWGFIESACTVHGRRHYRATPGYDTVAGRAARVPRRESVATAEERPPIPDRTSESRVCFMLSTETVD